MGELDSRSAIKQSALDLLVRHGYRGLRFGDIAAALGITRANIHYHFGSKAALIDEVLADYVDVTLAGLRAIWSNSGTSLAEKLAQLIEMSRRRYDHFNRDGPPVRPWSLISRLRQDEALLTEAGRANLGRFSRELRAIFAAALAEADAAGQLTPPATPAALAVLLVAIADNAAPITMGEGGFGALVAAYDAILTLGMGGPGKGGRR
jgi:AcrR family transcriptional regulator